MNSRRFLGLALVIIAIGVVFYFIGKGHAVYEVLPGEGAPTGAPEMAGTRRT